MQQRQYHILVAEEDDVALHRAVNLLKRRDYVVAGAPSAGEAHWWLNGWPVDLVVASATFEAGTGLQLMLSARMGQPEVAGLLVGIPETRPEALEARRHGFHVLPDGARPDEFLARVAECLASIRRRQRWPRKEVSSAVPMRIGSTPGRLMDVSYGGLKFELPDEPAVLRSPVEIDFPRADLRLRADVVWSARRLNGRSCVFGAAVIAGESEPAEWRAFVDRLT